jgi:hypothetical protein
VQRSSADLVRLRRDVEVVSDRLRHLAPARLAPVAGQVRRHVRDLAALSLAAHGQDPHPLGDVADAALGDQVAVLGREVAEGLDRSSDPDLLARALACLAAIRSGLP